MSPRDGFEPVRLPGNGGAKTASEDEQKWELAAEPRTDTSRRRRWKEPWVYLSFSLVLLAALLGVYLGLRFEGSGPILAFRIGPMLITIAACLTAFVGLVRSFLFRPFIRPSRMQAFACLIFVVAAINYPFPFPANREGQPSEIEFILPVRGEWTVVWGGDDVRNNRLARSRPDRRWGLDLVVTGENQLTFEEGGTRLEDFYAYGRPVFAPCAGTVVSVRSELADQPPGSRHVLDDEFGNHIVIEVAEGEYLFLSHLRGPDSQRDSERASILVKVGERVEAGQEIARVGNSGFSSFTPEPHLAIHLQDSPEPHLGQAIPWTFHGYLSDGLETSSGLPEGRGFTDGVVRGQRIQHE